MRYSGALSVGALVLLLAGCGGSQPPIGVPGALPQTSAIATHTDRGKSWMAPEAKSRDLLYVSRNSPGEVSVYTYPKGKPVGTLTNIPGAAGLCLDSKGDVFAVSASNSQILEYAHGGTTPISTLDDSGNAPNGCAIDPTTGNLAVSGGVNRFVPANIAVYKNAQGNPTTYVDGFVDQFVYCTYDASGNLYTNGGPITELPSGSGGFVQISMDQHFNAGYPGLQWDDTYLDIQDPGVGPNGPTTIFQVQISGSTAALANTISLSNRHNKNPFRGAQFWIDSGTIIMPEETNKNVGLWHFPKGGKAYRTVKINKQGDIYGVTISRASTPR